MSDVQPPNLFTKNHPEIDHSFAVVCYKDSPYLSKCIEALKNQTVVSKIYITTSTPSNYIYGIAGKFGIDVFVTEPGRGIAHDWNFALSKARTKYVTLAHQDDIYLPQYAEQCFKQGERYNDTLICFTDYLEITEDTIRKKTFMIKFKLFYLKLFTLLKKNIRSGFYKKFFLSVGSPIPCPSVCFNLSTLPGFEFSKEFSISLDWEAWYRMATMKGRFVYIPKTLLYHRIHPGSETTAGIQSNLRQNEDLRMFKKIWPSIVAKLLIKLYSVSYHSNKPTK